MEDRVPARASPLLKQADRNPTSCVLDRVAFDFLTRDDHPWLVSGAPSARHLAQKECCKLQYIPTGAENDAVESASTDFVCVSEEAYRDLLEQIVRQSTCDKSGSLEFCGCTRGLTPYLAYIAEEAYRRACKDFKLRRDSQVLQDIWQEAYAIAVRRLTSADDRSIYLKFDPDALTEGGQQLPFLHWAVMCVKRDLMRPAAKIIFHREKYVDPTEFVEGASGQSIKWIEDTARHRAEAERLREEQIVLLTRALAGADEKDTRVFTALVRALMGDGRLFAHGGTRLNVAPVAIEAGATNGTRFTRDVIPAALARAYARDPALVDAINAVIKRLRQLSQSALETYCDLEHFRFQLFFVVKLTPTSTATEF